MFGDRYESRETPPEWLEDLKIYGHEAGAIGETTAAPPAHVPVQADTNQIEQQLQVSR